MNKLITIILGSAVLIFGLMIQDVQAQSRDHGPEPEFNRSICNCGSNAPNRTQITALRMDCQDEADLAGCAAGSVHPVIGTVTVGCPFCPEDQEYREAWGCYFHGCPVE